MRNLTLGSVRKIKFNGLRNHIGANGGVIHDADTMLVYLCRLVRVPDGLKWQIVKNKYQADPWTIEIDQESLDDNDFDDVVIVTEPMIKWSINRVRGRVAKGSDYHGFINNIPF